MHTHSVSKQPHAITVATAHAFERVLVCDGALESSWEHPVCDATLASCKHLQTLCHEKHFDDEVTVPPAAGNPETAAAQAQNQLFAPNARACVCLAMCLKPASPGTITQRDTWLTQRSPYARLRGLSSTTPSTSPMPTPPSAPLWEQCRHEESLYQPRG